MAVFRGSAALDAVEEICGNDLDDVLSLLEGLIDKSLVVRVDAWGRDLRVRMLSIIREYAAERLIESGAHGEVRDRHAAFFLDLAERGAHEMWSTQEVAWLDGLEEDHENLRAALRWFVANERTDEALRLAASLRWFWWIRGHLSLGEHWLRRALELKGGSSLARGRALIASAALSIDLGMLGAAKSSVEEALTLFAEEGSSIDVAWAKTALGTILHALGKGGDAESLQRDALATFDAEGVPLGQCTASTSLASLEWSRGNFPVAEKFYLHSLDARRALGDPWGTAYVLTALGWTKILQHESEEAARNLEEALPLFRKVRFRDGVANALNGLGYIAAEEGRWDEAIVRFREALTLYREIGNRPFVAVELSRLARAFLIAGSPEDASDSIREAVAVVGEIEERAPSLYAVESLGCVLVASGQHERASRLFGAVDRFRFEDQVLSDLTLPLSRSRFERAAFDSLGEEAVEALKEEGRALSHDELEAEVERDLALVVG